MEFEEVAVQEDGPHTNIVHKFPLLNADGEIYAIGGIGTDITERKRAEKELLRLRDELAAELTAMTRLHELSTHLLTIDEFQPLLEEVLEATIALQNADFGNIQMYNPETQALEIVAQRGFQRDFLDYSRNAHDSGIGCGRTMKLRERVIIEDVETFRIRAASACRRSRWISRGSIHASIQPRRRIPRHAIHALSTAPPPVPARFAVH
jgi:PAS domain-containing protein